MKHPTRIITATLAALLLLAGSSATNAGGTKQDRDNYQNSTCRSDEIEAYLLQHGLLSPSQNAPELLMAATTPEVRVIYLVPSDKQPRTEFPNALANGIRHLQKWYSDQLGNGKTFKLHDPVVEVVRSTHDEKWFSTNPAGDNPSFYLWFNSINEASAKFLDPNFTYAIYVDVDAPGQSTGGTSGVAVFPRNDVLGILGQHPTEKKVCRWVGGLGHEIGHALGLPHPPECDSHQAPDSSFQCQSLMYLGYLVYPNTHLLSDNKDKLNQNPFIVPLQLDGVSSDCSDLSPFSISFNTSSQATSTGAPASYKVNVLGAFGYNRPVNLVASITPPNSTLTVSLSSNSIIPGASATLTVNTTVNTPPAEYAISITGSSDGTERTAVAKLNVIAGPSISAVNFDGKKKLNLSGAKFGSAPRVSINGTDRTSFITSMSDTSIRVKGKSSKLGLKTGDNTVQVFDGSNAASNIFVLRL